MIEFWDGLPLDFTFMFIPAECVLIVALPLLVPNTPGKVLVSSLLAASCGPLALAISGVVTGRPMDRPFEHAVYFLTSTYLCAVIAYVARPHRAPLQHAAASTPAKLAATNWWSASAKAAWARSGGRSIACSPGPPPSS